ncbi:tyrosine-type recombinase/integrase [Paraburkholderia graminis]|uniref:tyrosine-type recombinase/integrase n=1 Tax=Paraburkholderia graminis TaxID=60548 RepID=UPI0038BC0FA8
MALTAAEVRAAAPQEKPYKLYDSGGLFLLVTPLGSKLWRMKFRFAGREKLLTIGSFPTGTASEARAALAEARSARDAARRLLDRGEDPSAAKQAKKRTERINASNTFEAIAREWHERQAKRWAPRYGQQVLARLEADVFPMLGRRPVAGIVPAEILECLRKVEKRGAMEQARRAQQMISCALRYAVQTGRAVRDVSVDLRGAVEGARPVSYPAVTSQDELAKLIGAIETADCMFEARQALLVLAHVFTRPSELRLADWSEIDFGSKLWSIPASRMKLRRPHVVPLTSQVVKLLNQLKARNGDKGFVFPGRYRDTSISGDVLLQTLNRIGFEGSHVPHGFRSTASTLLHERGFDSDTIEAQLAHTVAGVRGVYLRSSFIDERRRMLEWWSTYLDGLPLL